MHVYLHLVYGLLWLALGQQGWVVTTEIFGSAKAKLLTFLPESLLIPVLELYVPL